MTELHCERLKIIPLLDSCRMGPRYQQETKIRHVRIKQKLSVDTKYFGKEVTGMTTIIIQNRS